MMTEADEMKAVIGLILVEEASTGAMFDKLLGVITQIQHLLTALGDDGIIYHQQLSVAVDDIYAADRILQQLTESLTAFRDKI